MANVTITVNGKKLTAPAGALLIDVCRKAGIEIPAFCYYPGLSLQAACRMCVVRQEKVPKLQTACTTTVAEGQVFTTESDEITQARRATLELLLGNHPLDCPVCDKGGECELQDMTFKYGAGESLYAEAKQHREEQQWSPAVYYDRPRCILCYRCIRVCGEGMDVWALALENRGARTVIAPNGGDHLDCEQCGMCIDVCPVGALTSGSYRYKTRPWEMKHISTVCTHCADGCRVTLGVRQTAERAEILRASNRDHGGLNGDFLCAKGRFGFDFVASSERLRKPLVRDTNGQLVESTWDEALRLTAARLEAVRAARSGASIGVIGSPRNTNEEHYLLQKFARAVLGTNHIDHDRSADYATFARTLAGHRHVAAGINDVAHAPAVLLIGSDPTVEHPLLAWHLRANARLSKARLYIANSKKIKLERQAKSVLRLSAGAYAEFPAYVHGNPSSIADASFRETVLAEEHLLVVCGPELRGASLEALLAWGLKRGNTRFALLGSEVNARGAADMGLLPEFLPGYTSVAQPGGFATEYAQLPATSGKSLAQMRAAAQNGELGALLITGANPLTGLTRAELKNTFVVVSDLFRTETAESADVVLPAASLYEKAGTVTNAFGDVQMVKKAADLPGVKSDFEILVRLAGLLTGDVKSLVPFGSSALRADLGQSRGVQSGEADRHAVWLASRGLEPKVSPFDPLAVLDEIERLVAGYTLDRANLLGGEAVETDPGFVPVAALLAPAVPMEFAPTESGLFTSPALGRYCASLQELERHQNAQPSTGKRG